MRQYGYGIHWLSLVVEDTGSAGFAIYERFFKDLFSELQSMGHGGRCFEEIWYGLLGFKVYVRPIHKPDGYFHFEIPGQACEQINWQILHSLDEGLRSIYPGHYHYTRLDFAFDNLPFTPQDVEDAISEGKIRSLAKRETMTINRTPFEKREDGEIGTHTVNLGSRQSERMIRVYNRRGFTRLELELKDRRADLVAKQILGSSDVSEWYEIALSHLLDYINFDADWWQEFIQGTGRAWATVTTPQEITVARMAAWVEHQVAAPLSVLKDIKPEGYVDKLLELGREQRTRRGRYDLLLSDRKKKPDTQGERSKDGHS